MYPPNIWRIATIVLVVVVAILGIALALTSRQVKVQTITITQTKFIKKNVYIERKFNPDNGTMISEKITDKSEETNKDTIKEKDVEKPATRNFIAGVGYAPLGGRFSARLGMVFLDTFIVDVSNPVALELSPAITASIIF